MKNSSNIILLSVFLIFTYACGEAPKEVKKEKNKISAELDAFLDTYNQQYMNLYYASSEAQWILNTRIVEGDTVTGKLAEEADAAYAAFMGSEENISQCRKFLESKDQLTAIQVKQLETILYNAGNNPAVAGEIVAQRIAAETKQTELLFGFETMIDGEPVSGNDINAILRDSKNLEDRLKAWEASKEVGKTLKSGLNNLKELRNHLVEE